MLASPSLWKVIAVASVTYIIFLQINLKPQFSPPSPDYPPLSSNDSGIPKKIWQTWHHPAISLNETEKERVQTWLTLNSDYRYELLTDASATSFIQRHYGTGDLKWVGDVYLALNDTILKADFLRYLVLHASGGVRPPCPSTSSPLSPRYDANSYAPRSTQTWTSPASCLFALGRLPTSSHPQL